LRLPRRSTIEMLQRERHVATLGDEKVTERLASISDRAGADRIKASQVKHAVIEQGRCGAEATTGSEGQKFCYEDVLENESSKLGI
jgi:hypothetical protein